MSHEGHPFSYTIRKATHSDKTDWHNYAEHHPQATPYHRFAWQSAVEEAYQHEFSGVLALDSNGNIVGLLPAITMAIPFKKASICALPYCDCGFAIADNEEVETALYHALNAAIERGDIASYEIRDREQNKVEESDLSGQKVRMLMPLPATSEALLASFKSKLRSQIKKAEKNGLTFKTAPGKQLLNDFYNVYSINMRDLGSPVHHIKWFASMLSQYNDNSLISVVYYNNIAVGAGIILKNGHKACIPWASTIQAYNKLAPNMLLYWSILAHCADNNVKEFDFGRSTYNEGTYKFKKQWGATPEKLNWRYSSEKVSHAKDAPASTGQLRTFIETVWRKLPLSLTIWLGSTIRGYISL